MPELILPELADYLSEVRTRIVSYCSSDLPEADMLLKTVASRSGKLIRPSLVILGGMAADNINEDHYIAAAVVEMFHIASLIHDDVLDQADTRRFDDSFNKLYGNKAAVLLGDLLVANAVEAASKISYRQPEPYDIVNIVRQTCAGELSQQRNIGNFDITEAEYLAIIQAKTAELLAGSLSQGFKLAGCEPELCDRAYRGGIGFGIAFQIMDDIADITREIKDSGKSNNIDFLQGKLTLPLIHYIETSHSSAIDQLKELANSNYSSKSQTTLIANLNQTGSLDYARDMAKEYMQTFSDFASSVSNETAGDMMSDLAKWVVK